MSKNLKSLIVLGTILALCGIAQAGPPLPLHTIEGNSGVFITSTAYYGKSSRGWRSFW